MSTLMRKACRDLRGHGWQCAGLTLIVAIIITLAAGAFRARAMLSESRDHWCQRLDLADLEIRFTPAWPGVSESALAVPGVAMAEERLLARGVLEAEGLGPLTALLQVLPETSPQQLSRWHILEGRAPQPGEAAVVLDRSVQRVHGIQVGDVVTVRLRDDARRLPVVGISISPEHLILPVHPEYDVPLWETLAVVGVSEPATKGIAHAHRVNSLLVRVRPEADLAVVGDALAQHLSVVIQELVPVHRQPSYAITTIVLADFELYMPAVTFVLAAAALLLAVLVFSRIVHRQRGQIGILLATGHEPMRIAGTFLPLAVVPVVLGTLIGACLYEPLARNLFEGFAASMGWAPLRAVGGGSELLLAAAVCLLVGASASLGPALALCRRRPSHLLRPATMLAVRSGSRAIGRPATRLGGLRRLPLSVVMGITHVTRRWVATAATVLGLGAIFAVLTAFLIVHVTYRSEVVGSARRLGLDAAVYFEVPVGDDVVAQAARAAGGVAEPLVVRHAVLQFPSGTAHVRLVCAQPGGWVDGLRLARGRSLSTPHAPEILVDQWTAVEAGLEPGVRVVGYPDRNSPEGAELTVVGVLNEVSMGTAVLPIETGRALFDLPGLTTAVRVRSPVPPDELEAALRELPRAEFVFSRRRALAQMEASFAGGQNVWAWAVFMAIGASVVFLGVQAVLDVHERGPDLALLHALGWRDGTLLGVSLTEVLARGLLALLLAIPLSPVLAQWLLDRATQAGHFHMQMVAPAWLFSVVIGAALVLMPLGTLPAWRASRELPPARVMRILSHE